MDSYTSGQGHSPENVVLVDNFTGTAAEKIQAAIDFAANNNKKTVLASDHDYYITSTIIVRKGVLLQGGQQTSYTIGANLRGFEIQQDASLVGASINVDPIAYNKEAVYLDGSQKFYNTWNRTILRDLVILNWSGGHTGTGLKLFSGTPEAEISFVDFENIKIVGFDKGIHLQARKITSGRTWINANRFTNLSLDDCVDMITIDSGVTVPNECSGNLFSNLQIQPSSYTKNILQVSGMYNRFDGMLWDISEIKHSNPIVTMTKNSSYNIVDIPSLPSNRYVNNGSPNNKLTSI